MNDRELLELAAKAAGVELKYNTFGQSETAERVYNYWNPLTDDEGGKPEFKWPKVVERAREMLAAAPSQEKDNGGI